MAENNKTTGVAKLKDVGQAITKKLLAQVESFANEIDRTPLTQEETIYAGEIVQQVLKTLNERGIGLNQIAVAESALPQQIKRFARMKLSPANNELFVDIRYNKNLGKNVVTLKKQYQGLQREMVWYYKGGNKISHFKDGIVCVGDIFEVEEDFDTGYDKIIKHKKNPNLSDDDRNKIENIVKAYAIAYEVNGDRITPITVIIDKKRIMRAREASPSYDKSTDVWKTDTKRMVLKTAYWCLYNDRIRPFIEIPVNLQADWKATNDEMEFETARTIASDSYETVVDNVSEGEYIEVVAE